MLHDYTSYNRMLVESIGVSHPHLYVENMKTLRWGIGINPSYLVVIIASDAPRRELKKLYKIVKKVLLKHHEFLLGSNERTCGKVNASNAWEFCKLLNVRMQRFIEHIMLGNVWGSNDLGIYGEFPYDRIKLREWIRKNKIDEWHLLWQLSDTGFKH